MLPRHDSIGHIDEKRRTITQLEGELRTRGVKTTVEQRTAGEGELGDEDMSIESFQRNAPRHASRESVGRCARRRNRQQLFSGGKGGQTRMLTALSGLRSELEGVKAQVQPQRRGSSAYNFPHSLVPLRPPCDIFFIRGCHSCCGGADLTGDNCVFARVVHTAWRREGKV